MKKALSLLLCAVMAVTVLFAVPFSAEAKTLLSGNFKYTVLSDGTIKLKKYIGDDDTVSVPSKIAGKAVTVIGKSCFSGNDNLLEVTIPKQVKKLESEVFYCARNVKSITLNCALMEIPYRTFCGCHSLTKVNIPSTVTKIDRDAFYHCYALTKVTIPKGVTTLGNSAFQGDSKLQSVTIPEGIKAIGSDAFYGCRELTGISVPKGVTSIGTNAFRSCVKITSLALPEGIESIGDYAFQNCKKLEKINLPQSLKYVGYDIFRECPLINQESRWTDDFLYLDNVLLDVRSDEAELSVKEGTKIIAGGALRNLKALERVRIPGSVTGIGDYAFCDCDKLKAIEGAENVEICGESLINYTAMYYDILGSKDKAFYLGKCLVLVSPNYTGTLTIAEGTKTVCEDAFEGTKFDGAAFYTGNCAFTALSLPASFTQVLTPAQMEACGKLKSISVSKDNPVMSSADGVLFNKAKTKLLLYPRAKEATAYTVPASVKTIGDEAFSGCTKLQSVTLGNKVKTIGELAFNDCRKLKKLQLGNSVKTIKHGAFYDCPALLSVTLPKSVETIESAAFFYCGYDYDEQWKESEYVLKGYKGSAAEEYSKTDVAFKECTNLSFVPLYYVSTPKMSVKSGKKSLKVGYTKVKNATGFEVNYQIGKKSYTKTYATKKSATKQIKKLKKGTYKVKIRAYSLQGGRKLYSKWSKTKTVKVK